MTSVPKNVYIDKLYDIINKYNNTYHNANKMKPVDVKSKAQINCSKEIDNNNNNNNLNLKLVILLEHQNMKIFLGLHFRVTRYTFKVTLQIVLKKFL